MQKQFRAILIDAKNKEIKEVLYSDLYSIYTLLNVDSIEIASYLRNDDFIFVDEEGLLKEHNKDWFILHKADDSMLQNGYFKGNGLVCHCDSEGENTDCLYDVQAIKGMVTFIQESDIKIDEM